MTPRTDRALSPVIGGVLLVAIVLVLAAVAGGVALSLSQEREPAPEVRVVAETTDDGHTQRLRHEQGDVIDGDKVTLRGTANPQQLAGRELGAGESVDFYPVEEEIRLVWAGDHGATYSLGTFEFERTLPEPDVGCSWVSTESDNGTENVKISGDVVDCDVTTDKVIEVKSDGVVIGDVTSDNKELDMDDSVVYGNVEVQDTVNVQDGEVTGSVTAHAKNIKIDNTTVGDDVTAGNKEIEVVADSTVDGDLVGDDDQVKVLSSSVSGSVVTEGTAKLDGATIEGDVYAGTFDCTDSTIDGQDCGSYTPKDPDDW